MVRQQTSIDRLMHLINGVGKAVLIAIYIDIYEKKKKKKKKTLIPYPFFNFCQKSQFRLFS